MLICFSITTKYIWYIQIFNFDIVEDTNQTMILLSLIVTFFKARHNLCDLSVISLRSYHQVKAKKKKNKYKYTHTLVVYLLQKNRQWFWLPGLWFNALLAFEKDIRHLLSIPENTSLIQVIKRLWKTVYPTLKNPWKLKILFPVHKIWLITPYTHAMHRAITLKGKNYSSGIYLY